MRRRQRWSAILAGAWLLVGGAAIDATLALAEPSADEFARMSQAEIRLSLMAVLEEGNPRLAASTSGRIADAVLRCHREHDLALDLVLGVMSVESSLRVSARSPKGAVGLMQVMPHMFHVLDLPGNPAHLESNVEAGCTILADNIRRLGEEDGISTYFWGSRIRGHEYLKKVQRVRRHLTQRLAQPAPEPGLGRG